MTDPIAARRVREAANPLLNLLVSLTNSGVNRWAAIAATTMSMK